MFLVPIKLRSLKFSSYLILIVLLVSTKNYALSISPCSIQICLIYASTLKFFDNFLYVLRTLLKVPPQKIIVKFDLYVQISLLLSFTFIVLKNSYLILLLSF